jgi:hypothetical protein
MYSLRVLTLDLEARSNSVPLPLTATEPCTGAYTCLCGVCASERLRLVKRRHAHQPWEKKAA